MKQFDSKEYFKHQSRKVVTRDGRPVRIICTNAKGDYPVVALVPCVGGGEVPENYTANGLCYLNGEESNGDLFFDTEKKEGWANVYRNQQGKIIMSTSVYDSKERAEDFKDNSGYLETVHIEWEE